MLARPSQLSSSATGGDEVSLKFNVNETRLHDLYSSFMRSGGQTGTGDKKKDEKGIIHVYFGAGCFWHVQHEIIQAEKRHLGRSEQEATALTGYAGGLKTGPGGKVCYHNDIMDSDYGVLGHSEAVGVSIPNISFPVFAKEFFDLFVAGERADPQVKSAFSLIQFF